MENTRTKSYFAYSLQHLASSDSELETSEFGMEDFCIAREAYLQHHERDTNQHRTGDIASGFFPQTQLFFLELDEERKETNRLEIMSNKVQVYPFGAIEPLAYLLLHHRNEGYEWFVEDSDAQRSFFKAEIEAINFVNSNNDEQWKILNLDKHMDYLEGKSIQYFLKQRSALSTNQLEILADLGRGTLSKIKNGQRALSRKQYHRIVRVLQHYGYVAWVDLREIVVEEH